MINLILNSLYVLVMGAIATAALFELHRGNVGRSQCIFLLAIWMALVPSMFKESEK